MPPRRQMQRVKVEHPWKLFGRVMRFVLKRYWLHYLLVLIAIVVSTYASVQGTMFTKTLIDVYIMPLISMPVKDYGPLLGGIKRVAMFYGIGVAAAYLRERLMIYISQGTLRDMRVDLFDKMETLPIRFFDTRTHGEIMSVYTNDIDTLRQLVSQSIPSLFQGVIQVSMVFVNMIILSPYMTGLSIFSVIVIFLVSSRIAGFAGRYFASQQKDVASLDGYVEEMINGQKVVKTFAHEEKAIEGFKKINDQLFDSAYNANKYSNILGPVNAQLGNVSYVLCATVGGYLAINGIGGFTLGSLASYLTLNRNFMMPINQMTSQINSILLGLAGAQRIFAIIDQEPEADNGYVTLVNAEIDEEGNITESEKHTGHWAWKHPHKSTGITEYVELKGDVVFDDVDFGYNPDHQILYNIDMYATPGQKIAFVGSTGAGKTTITNLINRFYDIDDGKIRYDGININKIKKDDLRHSLGIVLQDTHLFTTTVKENIRYGKLDATDEEVVAAAKLANAHEFITHLPQGYDTMLEGDGQNLSQGQRQLIAIARAAIADPPVLILDEATSSIDTRTEALVQEGMDKLMAGRTTFVIAHRLSTVRNADCIMVLEKGRIIERGSHDDLIAKQGRYYQLYTGNQAKTETVTA